MRTWTTGDKIAAAALVVSVIAVVVAISVPEIRCKIGLEQCQASKLYTGSVLDKEQKITIGGAEVQFFTQGTPITVYVVI